MTRLDLAVRALVEHSVEFVVIGAVAAAARGSTNITQDLDLCYARSPQNLERLAAALAQFRPRLRGAPEATAWRLDFNALKNGLNFTLDTNVGAIDLLGEVSGVGEFSAVVEGSTEMRLFGCNCRIAALRTIIASKRAAGRPKDLLALPELEALLELDPKKE